MKQEKNLLNSELKEGQKVSPTLPSNVNNYLIDIDGTVGEDIPNEEPERMVTAAYYPDALQVINKWYEAGHRICFFTSRTEAHRQITEEWLKKSGFKYHTLLMGKPRGGNYHWIDNHAIETIQFNGSFTELAHKKVKNEVFSDGEGV